MSSLRDRVRQGKSLLLLMTFVLVATSAMSSMSSMSSTSSTAQAPPAGAPPATAPPPPTMNEGFGKIQAGDFDGAIEILEQVTKREPENSTALRLLGFACIKTKAYDKAIEAYARSLEIEKDNSVALYNMAAAHALKGDKDKAIASLEKAKALRRIDMTQVAGDDDFASLKGDSRFKALLPKPEDFAKPFVEPVKIIREWDGESANDQFGWIARNLGDVDGDGIPDVVTSAPTKTVNGNATAGRVYVYSTKSGKLLWCADGEAGDQLGNGIEAAGDANHDGVPDVVAGAPKGGYARIYSGKDGKILQTLHEEKKDDQFGQHTDGVGDIDHDGYADVIIGAPGNDAGGDGAGRAYVFSGKNGHVLLTLTGERAGDAFGSAVAGRTSGKRSFLIVGAPSAGASKHGRVYVYEGLSAKPAFTIDADETGNALGGMFVAVYEDVNGDGVPDLYASDWSNSAKGRSTGRIYVHSGKDGKRLLTLTGETAGEGFGTSPSGAGDLDHDGHADLAVGAWQYAGAAVSGGRIYLHSGKDGHLLKTITCRIPGDTLGFDSVGMGDVDGDGTLDLLVTSAWSGIHGFHSGRMFIVSSGIK